MQICINTCDFYQDFPARERRIFCIIDLCTSTIRRDDTAEEMCMEILTWQARTKRGLTLRKLEELTGISRTTLNDIENGKVSPTLWELETIARALDMKISELYESDYK